MISRTHLPVVAAIPNYNMGNYLTTLIPRLLRESYDRIYILDDASTDDSRQIAEAYGPRVVFVPAKENGGAGAARNRVLPHIIVPTIIHFLDADIILTTRGVVEKIQALGIDEHTGYVGGLVRTSDRRQSVWNYGALQSIASAVTANILQGAMYIAPVLPTLARGIYTVLSRSHPHPDRPPVRRAVAWVLEGNLIIHSDTFRALGGFDATLREHDIQPLAYKTYQRGLTNYFDPSIAIRIRQSGKNVRFYNRNWRMACDEWRITSRYDTWLYWWLPFLRPTRPSKKK